MAFGRLMWNNWDWETKDVQILYTANKCFQKEERGRYERTRLVCFYVTKMAGMQAPKHLKPSDIFPLPGDKVEPKKIANFRVMTKEEMVHRYNVVGKLNLSDAQIDKMVEKNAKKGNRDRSKTN